MRILIANRGEIARRVIRTAHRLGHETVAAWADPDRDAPFVAEATHATRLGPAALAESYLSIDALLAAAKRSEATAVHPGYGFLSESAAFARAVVEAGLVWIGPHAEAIDRMGSKIEARRLAEEAGVPTIPGYDASQRESDLAEAAQRIGFPVLVKAAAGGGGKGIRIVHEGGGLADAIREAKQEAARSFGDDALIVERYVERARHVEVQIVGDRHGHVIDLGTRDCSIQRRYQKLLEEAPAPKLAAETSDGLRSSARSLAASIGYDSTGTVEYVVDAATGDYFFLEMNTRLQVEHPVTEAITGLDLVELQLGVAEGGALPLAQGEVHFRGHAFEARINAEDPAADFAPQSGRIRALRVPAAEGLRWESGVERGSQIPPYYDAMVAKLVVTGADREAARARLGAALDGLIVAGVATNAGFHRWLVEQAAVRDAGMTTRFLEANAYEAAAPLADAAALAAAAWRAPGGRASENGPWAALGAFRVTAHENALPVFLRDRHGEVHAIEAAPGNLDDSGEHLESERDGARHRVPLCIDVEGRYVALNLGGESFGFEVVSRAEHWGARDAVAGAGDTDAIRAPFPAVVTEITVSAGDVIEAGDVVVVIEAMKMLHSLRAREATTVAAIHVAVGDSVDSRDVLVSFVPGES